MTLTVVLLPRPPDLRVSIPVENGVIEKKTNFEWYRSAIAERTQRVIYLWPIRLVRNHFVFRIIFFSSIITSVSAPVLLRRFWPTRTEVDWRRQWAARWSLSFGCPCWTSLKHEQNATRYCVNTDTATQIKANSIFLFLFPFTRAVISYREKHVGAYSILMPESDNNGHKLCVGTGASKTLRISLFFVVFPKLY